MSSPALTSSKDPDLAKWQRALLPVMTVFVILLAALFFYFSTTALRGVGQFIQGEHGELREEIKGVIGQAKDIGKPDDVIRRGLLILEADALDRRYHQASALLMSRIWAKHLAFMTGMIMAFLGAIFILGKLSEAPSAVSGGSSQWTLSITSASPGILLAFFGTTLVAMSILIQGNIDVKDGPAYLRSVIVQNAAQNSGSHATVNSVDQDIMQALGAVNDQATPTPITPPRKK
jgi:hypothetical protein